MHVTTCILLLRMINILMHVARHRPIAARRVRIEPTARFHSQVGCLLHRLHGEIFGRLDDDRALATDPGDNGRPVFIVVPPPGLAFLAAPTRPASYGLLPTLLRLALVPRRVIEVISFDRALQLALHLVGQGGIAQPPAPPIAGPDMHPYLSGKTPRRTGEAEQKGGKYPVRQR